MVEFAMERDVLSVECFLSFLLSQCAKHNRLSLWHRESTFLILKTVVWVGILAKYFVPNCLKLLQRNEPELLTGRFLAGCNHLVLWV